MVVISSQGGSKYYAELKNTTMAYKLGGGILEALSPLHCIRRKMPMNDIRLWKVKDFCCNLFHNH